VTQRQLAKARHVPLEGAWTSCGAWFLMDAVEALRDDLANRTVVDAEAGGLE
jgi:iron complex transport system substrate-binding protein